MKIKYFARKMIICKLWCDLLKYIPSGLWFKCCSGLLSKVNSEFGLFLGVCDAAQKRDFFTFCGFIRIFSNTVFICWKMKESFNFSQLTNFGSKSMNTFGKISLFSYLCCFHMKRNKRRENSRKMKILILQIRNFSN